MRKLLALTAGILAGILVTFILLVRILFGIALYIIAFGAAYIILWEIGVI